MSYRGAGRGHLRHNLRLRDGGGCLRPDCEIFLVGADLPQGDAAAADLARDVVAVADQIAQTVAKPGATHAAVAAETAYRALEAAVREARRELAVGWHASV